MKRIGIIDYGMGNLGSLRRALEECGASPVIADHPEAIADVDALILPGVGSFADGMRHLRDREWPTAIHAAIHQDGKALLGICLGMQLLATRGTEGGDVAGLGIVPGHVERLSSSAQERIPHVGWNEVHYPQTSALFVGIPERTDFYFVHSYRVQTNDPAHAIGLTPYCGGFTSAIGQGGRIFGVQFHPEKSQRPGFRLLTNFIHLC